jgi:hypothetical protein
MVCTLFVPLLTIRPLMSMYDNLISSIFNFQLHHSRSLLPCEMNGPSRTDTSALVCSEEIARNNYNS